MSTNSTIQLEVGTPVIASDGKKLGKIKEADGQYFKVDAPMRRDYWLTVDEVLSSDEGLARLAIASYEVNDYKLSKPGASNEDGLLSAQDRLVQRERIERDLMNGGWR
ncbi:MAG: hypothetical protein M0R74_09295 [Dehalococcoidia bacterium]|nr:hypothetical protein [Dehalococcoidia bacterium]